MVGSEISTLMPVCEFETSSQTWRTLRKAPQAMEFMRTRQAPWDSAWNWDACGDFELLESSATTIHALRGVTELESFAAGRKRSNTQIVKLPSMQQDTGYWAGICSSEKVFAPFPSTTSHAKVSHAIGDRYVNGSIEYSHYERRNDHEPANRCYDA